MKQEAQLEFGIAKMSLGENDAAISALEDAALNDFVTGAHAKALLGDIRFKEAVDAAKNGDKETSEKKFTQAINTYTDVYYGYGGKLAGQDVKEWQAYASYEAARCHMVQINDADNVDKIILIGNAIDRFDYLLTRFPKDSRAEEARKQVSKLQAIKAKLAEKVK